MFSVGVGEGKEEEKSGSGCGIDVESLWRVCEEEVMAAFAELLESAGFAWGWDSLPGADSRHR